MTEQWKHFSHEADIGVCGFGATKEEAFEQAAVALTNVIASSDTVSPTTRLDIRCQAPNDELLLADWLNALVYEMATRGMLFGRFKVKITGRDLRAEVWGEKVDVGRHQPAVEIKAATYAELKVAQDPDARWRAQCVVDV